MATKKNKFPKTIMVVDMGYGDMEPFVEKDLTDKILDYGYNNKLTVGVYELKSTKKFELSTKEIK